MVVLMAASTGNVELKSPPVQGMLQAAQQAHQALQHALADRSHELVKTQAALQRLQADAQASQATSQAHADKLQQQVHVTGAFKSEALAQIKQLTDTLASTTQEHQVTMRFPGVLKAAP